MFLLAREQRVRSNLRLRIPSQDFLNKPRSPDLVRSDVGKFDPVAVQVASGEICELVHSAPFYLKVHRMVFFLLFVFKISFHNIVVTLLA